MINKLWDLTNYDWEILGESNQDYGVGDIIDPINVK